MKPSYSDKQIAETGAALGFDLTGEAGPELAGVIAEMLGDYEILAEPEPSRPEPERSGSRPDPADNPFNGWSWKGTVPGSGEGPLQGIEVAIKDTVGLAGTPMLNGSRYMEGFRSELDATIVTRMLGAGATIAGKSAVPAFCFEGAGITGYPEPFPENPRDPSRMPGASSSGSAALIAGGAVTHAIGGDQGGSIRIPASWCGCVGLKPTFGLVPYTGVFPVEMTLDSVGPMAATVAGVAELLEVIAGPDGIDPRQTGLRAEAYSAELERGVEDLRIGLLDEGFGFSGISQPAVDETIRRRAAELEAGGARVDRVSVPEHLDGIQIWNLICIQGATALWDSHGLGENWRGLYPLDVARFMRDVPAERADLLPDTLKATLIAGRLITGEYGLEPYARAQNRSLELRRAYDRAFEEFDVLLMPTTPMVAPPLPDPDELGSANTIIDAIGLDSARNVAPFNVSGHPAVSVPAGTDDDGLPIGLMAVAPRGRDSFALRVSSEVEKRVRENPLT